MGQIDRSNIWLPTYAAYLSDVLVKQREVRSIVGTVVKVVQNGEAAPIASRKSLRSAFGVVPADAKAN